MATSSPVHDVTAIHRGVEVLERAGYGVKLGEHVTARRGHTAGTTDDRVSDFNQMIRDPEVDAILQLRGGFGAAKILEHLDIRELVDHQKTFIGTSDATPVHLLYRTLGLPSIWGPPLYTIGQGDPYTLANFWDAIAGPRTERPIFPADDETELVSLVPGKAEAPIVGGTTTLLAAMTGTRWQLATEGCILLLEDVDEEPWVIDRLMTQLKLAGALDSVAGIVFSEHPDIVAREGSAVGPDTLPLMDILEDHVRDLGVPVLYGLPLGHTFHKASIPWGVRARLDADAQTLTLLETWFETADDHTDKRGAPGKCPER